MTSRLRVLVVSHSAALAGAEQALARLLAHLDPETIAPTVVLPEDGPLGARLREIGIPTRTAALAWWIPATHWSASQFAAQAGGLAERAEALAQLAKDEGAQLIHTNTLVTLEGALAAAACGLPHLWHSRGLFGSGSPPAYFDDRRFLLSVVDTLADEVVCVSRAVAEQTAEVCSRAGISVVPDPFDREALLRQPVASRAEVAGRLGVDPEASIAVALGGIQRRKGQLDLIEALALLVGELPHLVVALCGVASDTEYAAAVDARVAALGLADHVRRPGRIEDVRSLLAHADLFVQPSHSEGFGLALLEAMACSVPVVSTRCGGVEELLVDGESGLLVPVGDAQALAAAMRRLLLSPSAARRLGESAARVAARFGPRRSAEGVEAAYRRCSSAGRETDHAARAAAAPRIIAEVLARVRRAAVVERLAMPSPTHTARSDS